MSKSPPGAKGIAIMLCLIVATLAAVLSFDLRSTDAASGALDDEEVDCIEMEQSGGGVRLLGPVKLGFARASKQDEREVVTVSLTYAVNRPRRKFAHLYFGNASSFDRPLEPIFGQVVASSGDYSEFLPVVSEAKEPESRKGSLTPYNPSSGRVALPLAFPRRTQVQVFLAFSREIVGPISDRESLTVNVQHQCSTRCAQIKPDEIINDFVCPFAQEAKFRRLFLPAESTVVSLTLGEEIASLNAQSGVSQTPRGSEVHRLSEDDPELQTSLLLENPGEQRSDYLIHTVLLLLAGALLGSILTWTPK